MRYITLAALILLSLHLTNSAPLGPTWSEVAEELARAQRPVAINEQGFGDALRDARAALLNTKVSERLLRTFSKPQAPARNGQSVQQEENAIVRLSGQADRRPFKGESSES